MTVHSIHYCLGPIPTTSPLSQQLMFNQLSVQIFERLKSQKETTKVTHSAIASVNMIAVGGSCYDYGEKDKGVHTPPVSSPYSNCDLGLGQVLVEKRVPF